MCIPYIIPDPPPPGKRFRNGGRGGISVQRVPPKSTKLQPAYIEISPRLTYIASPKPSRSPVPLRHRPGPPEIRPSLETRFQDAFATEEQASRLEKGMMGEAERNGAQDTTSQLTQAGLGVGTAALSSQPIPAVEPTPPSFRPRRAAETIPVQRQPPPMTPPQPQQQPQSPPPVQPRFPTPPIDPRITPHTLPQFHRPSCSPHSYIRRPPPRYRDHRRSRSLSLDSTISRRSFERLKRTVNELWERVRVLERWKVEQEQEREVERKRVEREVERQRMERDVGDKRGFGMGRRAWELGGGARDGRRERERERREGSLMRERRERERGRGGGDVGRDGHGERWDWEGGGLGRR